MHTIIVGAGISGLWLAEQLALRGDKVTVLEKSDYLGGRIVTSERGFEIGAGRIATHHRITMDLLDRFGLKTHRISNEQMWKKVSDKEQEPNNFDIMWDTFLGTFQSLDKEILATHTLKQIATKILGPSRTNSLLSRFGYRAETEVLRADLGIKSFQKEMSPRSQFVVVKGGLSQLIQRLATAARKAGATILMNTTVLDVIQHTVYTSGGEWSCDRVILAVPVEALRHMPCTRNLPVLRYLRMEPLTRIYATMDAPWTYGRIITDSPLRHIIPIRDNLVMISYVESQDTRFFRGLRGPALRQALQREVKRLFPDAPKITWAHAYEWTHGCTYWLPGKYDPIVESNKAMTIGTRLHLCNESFSLRQAWIEGCLEHATNLLKKLTNPVSNTA
jgi:monoamine oxidase